MTTFDFFIEYAAYAIIFGIVGFVLLCIFGLFSLIWGVVREGRLHTLAAKADVEIKLLTAQAEVAIKTAEAQTIINRATLAPADGNGLYPISIGQLQGLGLSQLQLSAHMFDTRRTFANVPNSVHYSVKSESHLLEDSQLESKGNIVPATDFFGLFMGGKLPKDKFLVGTSLDDGSEIFATWQNLYSALIGGMSGSGKSTLIRSLLAQSALQGGRFVVIDPHYGAGEESLGASLEPLRSLMLCDVASNDREMSSALKYVADIGQRRLSGQNKDKTLSFWYAMKQPVCCSVVPLQSSLLMCWV